MAHFFLVTSSISSLVGAVLSQDIKITAPAQVPAVLSQDMTITAPVQVPASASLPIDDSYLSLMIDSQFWPDYGGTKSHPNTFTNALVANLAGKKGSPLEIRVGGTSGDNVIYNSNQAEAIKTIRKDPNGIGLKDLRSLGPAWLEAFQTIPDARYVLEVPLQTQNLGSSIDYAKIVVPAIGSTNLNAVEVGNEPDLYAGGYSPVQYVNQFIEWSKAIESNTSLPPGPIFQAGGIASGGLRGWAAPDIYKAGLGKSNLVESFSMHYYQTFVDQPLISSLLNHNQTETETTKRFQGSINWLRTNQPHVPFVISEAGSSLADRNHRGDGTLDRVLGSALWLIDWTLYTASIGVSKVNMATCTVCNFASWRPIPHGSSPPAVLAQYYGLAFVADFLGLETAPQLRVTSLYNEPAHPNLSPYAAYVNGVLDRYVVVDLNMWNSTETKPRPDRTVGVAVPNGVKGAQLRRLTGSGTDARASNTGNITWAGVQYTFENPKGLPSSAVVEALKISNGKALFSLKASEAVLVTLQR